MQLVVKARRAGRKWPMPRVKAIFDKWFMAAVFQRQPILKRRSLSLHFNSYWLSMLRAFEQNAMKTTQPVRYSDIRRYPAPIISLTDPSLQRHASLAIRLCTIPRLFFGLAIRAIAPAAAVHLHWRKTQPPGSPIP